MLEVWGLLRRVEGGGMYTPYILGTSYTYNIRMPRQPVSSKVLRTRYHPQSLGVRHYIGGPMGPRVSQKAPDPIPIPTAPPHAHI